MCPCLASTEELPALGEFYEFRRDVGFEQNPLRLDGKTYRKGLALQSRTVLSYQVAGQVSPVQGHGRHRRQRARHRQRARWKSRATARSLWQGEVRGSEPARELELDISRRASAWRSWSTTATIWTLATAWIWATPE